MGERPFSKGTTPHSVSNMAKRPKQRRICNSDPKRPGHESMALYQSADCKCHSHFDTWPLFLAFPTLRLLSFLGHPFLCCPETNISPQARHPFIPAQTSVIQKRVRQVSHCTIKELELWNKAQIPAAIWKAKWH